MPSLGADMVSGILVEWRVEPGATLRRGDIIGVVETEKGAIDIEVFEDCVVTELVVAPGTEVKVDGVLARLQPADDAPSGGLAPGAPTPTVAPVIHVTAPLPEAVRREPTIQASPRGQRVSPAARRRANELGIDLAGLRGTGVGGAVCLADVEGAATAGPAPRKARSGFDGAAMRRAIGHAMARSKREIPHYYLSHAIPLGTALAWLTEYNRQRPVPERLLPAVLLLKATGLAVARHPELNGYYEHEAFRPARGVHLGWAIALRGGGLVAPAIHDVERQDLPTLMASLRDLVQRARGGGLRSSELMDPGLTVTSLGERSADTVIPVIYPPQVAVIGFGSIVERPWVVQGTVIPQPVVNASLAADHRVSDGHRGAQLLADIAERLQHPETL